MKLQHFLSAFFVAAIFPFTLFSVPCTASFVCSNDITLESDGMSWDYEECITYRDAVFFRELIDRETGNNDSFVNAWELRNMELELRERLEKSIEKKPDVKLDGSSKAIKVRNVEFWLSDEALGSVYKNDLITNTARVSYSFEEKLKREIEVKTDKRGEGETDSESGSETGNETLAETNIWFLGTPDSEVTIVLPPGYDSNRTEGLENKSEVFEDGRMVLKGSFGSGGEITLWLSENESYEEAALMDFLNENELVANETLPVETPQPEEPQASAGIFENFLRRLCLNPKA